LYNGYYAESVTNNPEDPTVGTVFMTLPPGNGSFSGLMPFSYVGCTNAASVATVSGTRSGSTLTGSFSGTVDGVNVAGTFTGTLDGASGTFSGNWSLNGGRVLVVNGSCNYFVAANGNWKLWSASASEPASFVVSVGAGTSPTITWTAVAGAVIYAVRVFDETCLQTASPGASCYLGELYTNATSASYPGGFARASALAAGRSYIVTVAAQGVQPGSTDPGPYLGYTSTRIQR
jgi:hypothetical protein